MVITTMVYVNLKSPLCVLEKKSLNFTCPILEKVNVIINCSLKLLRTGTSPAA